MKNVGILAAMTISTLGPASDVDCFFKSIVFFLENGKKGSKYPLVTERLYCRSLDKIELSELKLDLEKIRVELNYIAADSLDINSFGLDKENTRLFLNSNTLADVFSRFFEIIFDAIECTNTFYKEFKEYVPLRIGFTEAPDYILDANRSRDLYDSLSSDELPFWLR